MKTLLALAAIAAATNLSPAEKAKHTTAVIKKDKTNLLISGLTVATIIAIVLASSTEQKPVSP